MRRPSSRRVVLDLKGLIGKTEIFRLSGGARRDPAVDRWFAAGPSELKSAAREWFMRMRRCGADVRELLHDGCPVACVNDVPFAYVNSFKSHVNVGFFNGAALEDPAGLLQGSGKRMRHVKLTLDTEVDAGALRDLIDAAYSDVRARLADEQSSK